METEEFFRDPQTTGRPTYETPWASNVCQTKVKT